MPAAFFGHGNPMNALELPEGGEQRGKTYRPIIRTEPTGVRTVTGAEFVEAGLLREYRKRRVPMAELRAFIDELRNSYNVPYPHRPGVAVPPGGPVSRSEPACGSDSA